MNKTLVAGCLSCLALIAACDEEGSMKPETAMGATGAKADYTDEPTCIVDADAYPVNAWAGPFVCALSANGSADWAAPGEFCIRDETAYGLDVRIGPHVCAYGEEEAEWILSTEKCPHQGNLYDSGTRIGPFVCDDGYWEPG